MRSRLVLLTAQTITLGLMMAFLVVPASALFLHRYGAGGLPYAYLAVAASGVVISAAIRRAQARSSVVMVALSVLSAYLVLVAGAWLILTTSDGFWVTFPLLVLFPLSIPLGFLIVGAQAGRLLDVREMKARLPRVVAGFSVGFGIGSLASAWLAPALGDPAQLLGFSAAATVIMIGLVTATAGRDPDTLRARPAPHSPTPAAEPRSRGTLLRNPLVLAIFGYQLLSSAVSQLLDYIVWERAAARYPDSLELTRFMGFFGVVINVVTIVFVGVFAGRLLTRFGVGVGLWANPAGVLLLLSIAAVAGSVGSVAGVGFFVAACAGQVADIALTDGMTRTGIAATYQVLPVELRLRAQTMIEGAGVPLALGFVGVLLLIFHAVSLDVMAVTAVTVVLALLWLLLARKAFLDYGRKLRLAVTSRPWDPRLLPVGDPASRAAVRRLLDSADPIDRGVGLRALADAGDPGLPQHVADLLVDPDPGWQVLGLDTAVRGGMVGLAPEVMHIALDPTRPGDLRAGAVDAGVRLGAAGAEQDLAGLLDDPDMLVRVAAAAALVNAGGDLGGRALDSWRSAVRAGGLPTRQALTGAAASPSSRFLPDLLDLGASTTPPEELAAALDAHADMLVPVLAEMVASGSPSQPQVERVMRAVTRSWSAEAFDVLQRCLTGDRRATGVTAARALAAAERTIDPTLLRPAIKAETRYAGRASAALAVLEASPLDHGAAAGPTSTVEPLRRALRDEIDATAVNVTRLIGLAYGRRMVRAVIALGSGSAAERGLALEALEVTMGADLARISVPLIDPTLAGEQRRRHLARVAPHAAVDAGHWLRDMAFDHGGSWQETWLLICALYAAPEVLGPDAVAFARKWEDCDDPVVAETARWALAEASRDRAIRGVDDDRIG